MRGDRSRVTKYNSLLASLTRILLSALDPGSAIPDPFRYRFMDAGALGLHLSILPFGILRIPVFNGDFIIGAGRENRTPVLSLARICSTTKPYSQHDYSNSKTLKYQEFFISL